MFEHLEGPAHVCECFQELFAFSVRRFAVGLWPDLMSRPRRPGLMRTELDVLPCLEYCGRVQYAKADVLDDRSTRKRGRIACTAPFTTGLFLET